MSSILESKYKKSELNKVMTKKCQHLSTKEREIILTVLSRFKYLFGGKFCTWNTTMVELELKYNVKSICLQPYPVPKVNKVMLSINFKYYQA